MHFCLRIILGALLLQGADTPQPDHIVATAKYRKLALLRLALSQPLFDQMQGLSSEQRQTDVCTWKKGIECTDNVLTGMFARKRRVNVFYQVELESLPPTLRYIHFMEVFVKNVFQADALPRELRYLNLFFCHVKNPSGRVHFEKLPSKMEELIVFSNYNSLVGRVLHFSALPETMRVIYIRHYRCDPSIDAVDVNYDSLPLSLEQFVITDFHDGDRQKLMKKITTRGQVAHVKLGFGEEQIEPKVASRYLDEYSKKTVQKKNKSIA